MKHPKGDLCCNIKWITNIFQQIYLKEYKNNSALKHPGSYLIGATDQQIITVYFVNYSGYHLWYILITTENLVWRMNT